MGKLFFCMIEIRVDISYGYAMDERKRTSEAYL